jgi:hypothetical protein
MKLYIKMLSSVFSGFREEDFLKCERTPDAGRRMRDDGRRAVPIAHPEQSSAELKIKPLEW